jgi:cytochrome P460
MPVGYRDWKLISVAHEEANLNSFGAMLGNEIAIKAYRDGTLLFLDGAIIAATIDGACIANIAALFLMNSCR